ncbi:MAG TPA: flagellar hook-length control protein FliK [Hypericibacter adhaerens]|uniref:flagellar hook-length control protein FliK n=1 Tax=Hypericibacter adhaerens TaxID=2602016 RepID=UPI002B931CA3|nr:flagellar hook-length control protein FliK [Hypericibacter adhaerens]HWA44894.1 flagellar hook-length control protein FliK [Hypericibacter adhaerens]
MEAIQTDTGTAGIAQGLFGKAQGQTGKGGGLFAALLALVGRATGDGKEAAPKGDGSADAAAGLQGLLALFNPAPIQGSTDQTLIGDSGDDPLTAVAAANGLDLSQLGDRNKLALLAQALANAGNGEAATPATGAEGSNKGIALDPATTGQTLSAADLDAILAELRARAAAKFGADNGKPALTQDGMNAALAPKADPSTPAAPTGPSPAPLVEDTTQSFAPDAASPAASTSAPAAAPAATPPAHPASAAGSFISIETTGDEEKPAEDADPAAGGEPAASPANGKDGAAAAPTEDPAPPSKTPDAGTSPFQKVEVAPPANAKSGAREPVHAAATPDSDKKAEPKPEPATASASDSDRTDKAASDDNSSRTTASSDSADAGPGSSSSSTANVAAVDTRSHTAVRGPIQVPVEKLSQFLTQDDQLPLQIQRAAANGRDHITIQIVPHDLGRIEIKLDFDRSGTINTVIAADRPQTLDLLKRDATGLERALQDAGFKTDGSSLSFNLQSDQRQQYQNQQNNPGPAAWQSSAADEVERAYRPTYRIASTADAIRAAADGRLNIAV